MASSPLIHTGNHNATKIMLQEVEETMGQRLKTDVDANHPHMGATWVKDVMIACLKALQVAIPMGETTMACIAIKRLADEYMERDVHAMRDHIAMYCGKGARSSLFLRVAFSTTGPHSHFFDSLSKDLKRAEETSTLHGLWGLLGQQATAAPQRHPHQPRQQPAAAPQGYGYMPAAPYAMGSLPPPPHAFPAHHCQPVYQGQHHGHQPMGGQHQPMGGPHKTRIPQLPTAIADHLKSYQPKPGCIHTARYMLNLTAQPCTKQGCDYTHNFTLPPDAHILMAQMRR